MYFTIIMCARVRAFSNRTFSVAPKRLLIRPSSGPISAGLPTDERAWVGKRTVGRRAVRFVGPAVFFHDEI